MMSKDRMGIARTIKEFGESYEAMDHSKYVVEEDGGNIEISHMKYDDDYERWLINESISIPFACANTLFSEMAWAIENGEITCDVD